MSEPRRIKDIPAHERPRERLARLGPSALSDAELLAIFFRTGIRGLNAIELGSQLIDKYGGLGPLSRCSVQELTRFNKGLGVAKATELLAIFEMARRVAAERLKDLPLDTPEAIFELLGLELQAMPKETIRVVALNSRFRLMRVEEISLGTATEALATPADVLRPVVICGATGFVLAHNHPSGDTQPSSADQRLTRRIGEAARLLHLRFLDHVIIGQGREGCEPYFSFRAHGMMPD